MWPAAATARTSIGPAERRRFQVLAAVWGFDAVKVDFLCGIAANLDPKTVFTEFAQALRNTPATGRSSSTCVIR
jgi:hypothetical protein